MSKILLHVWQTVQTLIRCSILWPLIWVYTVCNDLSVPIPRVIMVLLNFGMAVNSLKSNCSRKEANIFWQVKSLGVISIYLKWDGAKTDSPTLYNCILEESNFNFRNVWLLDLHIPREKMAKLFANSEDLIRRRILQCLIRVCTVCKLLFHGSPDYNG